MGSGTGGFTIGNGAMLNLGQSYSITASPNSSTFSEWVNEGLISFNPTLSFVMESNLVLTAKFLARQRPAVSISTPAGGAHTGSAVLKGTGVSSPVLPGVDPTNVALVQLTYWLTNIASGSVASGSAALVSAGSVSNWSVTANPAPGSNILAVQAEDVSGGVSAIVNRTFFYDMPALFTLIKSGSGSGTITGSASVPGDVPPTNGAMLNVGERYTVTATPAALCTFSQWVSADVPGTADRTLTFIMEPGLTLTAVFTEIPPVVTISSPTENQRTAAPVLKGSASGHFPITHVICTLAGGAVNFVTLSAGAGGALNWEAYGVPSPGSNILSVSCVDSNGNQSATVSRRFFYEVPTQLMVNISRPGSGTVKGASSVPGNIVPADGAMLNVGEGYRITAIPSKSSLFSDWVSVAGNSAPVTSDSAALSFVMQSNLVLTVTFVTNFFPAVAGPYNGLFYPAGGVTAETSGMVYNLVLRDSGAFSGQLLMAATNYDFAGSFNGSGQAMFKAGPLQADLTLDTATAQITGTVSDSQFTANVTANLASSALPAAEYTFLFSPSTDVSAVSPPGDGYALVGSQSGIVKLAGALADGTRYNQSVPASQNGDAPVYASLYKKALDTSPGLLLGWINLTNFQGGTSLTWIKKPSRSSSPYANGFTNILSALGGIWTNPPANVPAIALTNGQLIISNSSLMLTYTNVVVTNNNSLTNTGVEPTNSLTGAIDPTTGFLTVIIANGIGGTITNYGAVLQSTTNGGGYFLSGTNAGLMILQP
jgi:hypothetical protein